MSLKAKVEAIIYAAEEPITLEQISLLLKDAVLAELAAARENLAIEQADSAAEAAASQPAESQESDLLPQFDPESPTSAFGAASAAAYTPAPATEEPTEPELVTPEPGPLMPQSGSPSDTEITADPQQDEPCPADAPPPEPPESPATEVPAAEVSDATPPESSAETAPLPTAEPEPANSASVAAPETAARKRQPKKSEQEIADDKIVRIRLREILAELVTDYTSEDRGMEIRQVAGGFRMATKPEHHDVVRAFAKSLKPPIRLSLAALETLAVIAYKQPVTGPEIADIRGVESASVLGTLLDRKLITTAGRKQVIGRPMQYKTSKDFLLRFGLNDVNELPSMEEFSQLVSDSTIEIAPSDTQPAPSLFEPDQAEASEPAIPNSPNDADASLPQTTVVAQASSEAEASEPAVPYASAEAGEWDGSTTPEPQSTQSPSQQPGEPEDANSQPDSEAESASQPEAEHPIGH
jgi:segregation and condensation protein B